MPFFLGWGCSIYLQFRFIGVTVIWTWLAQTGCSPPHTHTHTPQQITLHHLDLHGIAAPHSACWHVFHVDMFYTMFLCSSSLSLFFFFLFPPWPQLAAFGKNRSDGESEPLSAKMLFSIWHDASSRSHFHCDCRAPSESIDNPCQALAPPTGAGTAS